MIVPNMRRIHRTEIAPTSAVSIGLPQRGGGNSPIDGWQVDNLHTNHHSRAACHALLDGSGTESPAARQAMVQASIASRTSSAASSGVAPTAEQPRRSGATVI